MGNKLKWYQYVFHFVWVRIYTFLHLMLLGILTKYILENWKTCISMQFFSRFDGNNILFLVWIADILLFFYDVEIKEGKLHRRNIEEAKKQVQDKDIERQIEQRVGEIDRVISEISTETNGGDEKQ